MAEAKKIEVLGKELEVKFSPKRREAYATMNKASFDAVLEEKGVTKEMRDTFSKANDEIVSEVSKSETEFLLAANKGKKEDDPDYIRSLDVRLGAGDFSLSVKKIPHIVHSGKDMSGKPYEKHKYGNTVVTLNYSFAAEFRKEGGQADQESKKFMDALMKKK